jgi:hypothetical protein
LKELAKIFDADFDMKNEDDLDSITEGLSHPIPGKDLFLVISVYENSMKTRNCKGINLFMKERSHIHATIVT